MKRCILALFLVAAAAARGEPDLYQIGAPLTTEFGLFAGLTMGGDVEKEGPAFGGQAAFNITRYLAVEVGGFNSEESLTSRAFAGADGFDTKLTFDVMAATLTVRLALPLPAGFRIYGLAGGGFYYFDLDDTPVRTVAPLSAGSELVLGQDVDMDSQYGWHVGAGVDWKMNNNIKLFAEYRHTSTGLDVEYDTDAILVVPGQDNRTFSVQPDYGDRYAFGMARLGFCFYY